MLNEQLGDAPILKRLEGHKMERKKVTVPDILLMKKQGRKITKIKLEYKNP